MKFEINFEKKHFWMILSLVLVLSIGIIAYAYGTSAPATFGHSVNEIDWDTPITGNIGTKGVNPNTLPTGWGGGISTWDVYAQASVRANQICLGGSKGGIDLGDCRTSWPSGGTTGAGVSTFNGRSGAVTLTQADITATGFVAGSGITYTAADASIVIDNNAHTIRAASGIGITCNWNPETVIYTTNDINWYCRTTCTNGYITDMNCQPNPGG